MLRLYGTNDTFHDSTVSYKVHNVTDNRMVSCATANVHADSTEMITQFPMTAGEQKFYLIEWEINGKKCNNHYFYQY